MEDKQAFDRETKSIREVNTDSPGDKPNKLERIKRNKKITSRRKFFRRLGWGAIVSFLFGGLIATIKLFYPRVLFEPAASFIAGQPDEYPPGSVSTRYKDKFRVWIVRKDDGRFICLSAKCTHLGCTPNWLATQDKFKCPCHGSGFQQNGINFEGPAPRPLDRFKIDINSEGLLVVDRSILYKGRAGLNSDELYPESILSI